DGWEGWPAEASLARTRNAPLAFQRFSFSAGQLFSIAPVGIPPYCLFRSLCRRSWPHTIPPQILFLFLPIACAPILPFSRGRPRAAACAPGRGVTILQLLNPSSGLSTPARF